jgi:hypothetical protein
VTVDADNLSNDEDRTSDDDEDEGDDLTVDAGNSTTEVERTSNPAYVPRAAGSASEVGKTIVDSTKEEETTSAPAKIPRAAEPSSEFEQNGLIFMELFRPVFPLIRRLGDEFFPLNSKGTIPTKLMRHALLQFTTVAATTPHLLFLHANQVQRHTVLRTVAARASEKEFIEFTDLVNHKDFASQVAASLSDPSSKQSRQFIRKITNLISLGEKINRGAELNGHLALYTTSDYAHAMDCRHIFTPSLLTTCTNFKLCA